MGKPLGYDELLAQLNDAKAGEATRATREREAFVAALAVISDNGIEFTHDNLADAARHIREDGWQPKAQPTYGGARVHWFIADREGNQIKPTQSDADTGTWPVDDQPTE